MPRIVRRLLRPRPGRASPAASRPTGSETAVERLQSYHVERSNEMDKEQQGDAAGVATVTAPLHSVFALTSLPVA